MLRRPLLTLTPLALSLLLSGCAVGPDYLRAENWLPSLFRDTPTATATASESAANPALNADPDFTYVLWETPRGHLVLAQDLGASCLARYGLEGRVVATAPGVALDNVRFRHPFYDRAAPVYLGDYVTLETGTGIVHSSPAQFRTNW